MTAPLTQPRLPFHPISITATATVNVEGVVQQAAPTPPSLAVYTTQARSAYALGEQKV
jgi:hypothetical protein